MKYITSDKGSYWIFNAIVNSRALNSAFHMAVSSLGINLANLLTEEVIVCDKKVAVRVAM